MALIVISQPYLLKPHAYFNFNDASVVSFYLASPVKQSGLVRKMERETGLEPATTYLEGRCSGQLNYSRRRRGNPGIAPEKIGTLRKGRRFSLFPCIYYTKKFLKNQLIF